MKFAIFLPLILAFAFSGCNSRLKEEMVRELINDVRKQVAPDARSQAFNIHGQIKSGILILSGDIHNAEMKQQLINYLKKRATWRINDQICVLPDPALEGKTFGVVSVSTANLRLHPNHAADLGTQALLGTPLAILKKQKGWFFVETPDHYLGWTDDRIVPMTKDEFARWVSMPKIMVTVPSGFTYAAPKPSPEPVSDVVIGSLLALKSQSREYYEVNYPDGRSAFLTREAAQPMTDWLKTLNPTPERILFTARRFTGIPYLWGGTSAKGLDCSGFIKTVYYLNGLLLPRDADQQAATGLPVEPRPDWSGLAPGDLLFFGSPNPPTQPPKVTHVALSLGGGRFIHADQDVHINSLNSNDPDYNLSREKSFVSARRILGTPSGNGITRILDMPYFQNRAN